MHAENDRVIPYELGYQLYRSAVETRGRSWGPAEFHRFEGKFGHKFMVKAKGFAETIDQFIRRYKNETYWMNLSSAEWVEALRWWIIHIHFPFASFSN